MEEEEFESIERGDFGPKEGDQEELKLQAERVKAYHKVKTVLLIVVEGEDNEEREYRAWLRKPTLKTQSAVFSLGQADPIAGAKKLFSECFLEGDKEILNDDELFAGAMIQMEGLMKARNSYLVKF